MLINDLRSAPGFAAQLRQRPHRVARRRWGRSGIGANRRRRRPGLRRDRRRRRTAPSWSSRTRPAAGSESGRRSRSWPASPRRSPLAASRKTGSAFCLDTAHAWGAGYRLSDPDVTDELLDDVRCPDRDRPAEDGPPQRLEVGARLAHTIATSTSAPGRSARPAWPTSCVTRSSPESTYFLETPGMDEGYDAINVARARRARRGSPARAAAAGRDDAPRKPGSIGARTGARARLRPDAGLARGARPPPRVDRPADARPRSCSRASLVLAAVLRFVNLADARDVGRRPGPRHARPPGARPAGELPLLGPPTSIGDFHHGVLYYYLLAPAAALSGRGPARRRRRDRARGRRRGRRRRGGWRARSVGPSPAAVAGLLMAVSASAVDESTFIWNPNLIALSSSVALAAAWRAWTGGRARWWVVAGLGRHRHDALPRARQRARSRRSSGCGSRTSAVGRRAGAIRPASGRVGCRAPARS